MSAKGASHKTAVQEGNPHTGAQQTVPPTQEPVKRPMSTHEEREEEQAPASEVKRPPAKPTSPSRSVSPPPPELDEGFLHRVTPVFKLLRLYSRLEVSGLERIPEKGAVLAANHTGWLGLDYAYTALSVYDAKKRIPHGMAHATWFKREASRDFARRLGLFEANKDTLRETLKRDELVLLFPEGEKGAFKGERDRYVLQPFAHGWLQAAMEADVPVVPVAIIGGEEANPSSGRIDSYEKLLDLSLPMPQNLFPRPVKWAISFLEPVHIEGGPEAAQDRERVREGSERVRSLIQSELQRLLSLRGHPYL